MSGEEGLLSSPQDEFHLGCLLLAPSGVVYLTEALEAVSPDDFDDATYGWLWAAARVLHGRGERVTKRSLTALREVTSPRKQPGEAKAAVGEVVAGLPFIAPSAATLAARLDFLSGEPVFAARIQASIRAIKEHGQRRRLVQELERLRSQAITADSCSEAVATAQDALSRLETGGLPTQVRSFADLVGDFAEWQAGGLEAGQVVPTPWPELNAVLSGGFHSKRTFVFGGRPGAGKSIGGLNCAQCAAEQGFSSLVISAEMPSIEVAGRLMAAGACVEYGEITRFAMSDHTATAVSAYAERNRDMPLWVVDKRGMTVEAVSAIARSVKRRHGLDLLMVDYLQLLRPTDGRASREQQVAHISSELHTLAGDLDCALVTLAQLNRDSVKSRRKPTAADLRDSGCLTRETTLLRADTGAPVAFGTLIDQGYDGVLVWSLDEKRRLVAAPITNVYPSGVKNTFRLSLASGRKVTATGNHRFLTFSGWAALETLAKGDRIAVPRHVPAPLATGLDWSEHRLGLLAHLIGDGCVIRGQPVHYTSQDDENLDFVEQAAAAEFGIKARRVQQSKWQHVYLPAPWNCGRGRRNPLNTWLAELGIENLRSYEKRIPDAIYGASDDEICVFLRHLWATDGCIFIPSRPAKSPPRVYYSTSSRVLADGVAVLLGRLNIPTRLYQKRFANSKRPGWHLVVAGSAAMIRFCREVGTHGRRAQFARTYLDRPAVVVNTNVDTLPPDVWSLVKSERLRIGMTERQLQAAIGIKYRGSTMYKTCPSRERLMRCAEALGSEMLREAANDDVFWDKVVSIEPLGPQPVYDATVKGTHNFIADGIVAHNSIEQDADVVILLHHQLTDEGDPTGMVTLIVDKNRFGPKTDVELRWRGHQARIGEAWAA